MQDFEEIIQMFQKRDRMAMFNSQSSNTAPIAEEKKKSKIECD